MSSRQSVPIVSMTLALACTACASHSYVDPKLLLKASAPPIGTAPAASLTIEEAAHLAKQASFGPTPQLISAIFNTKSIDAWISEQFTLSSSTYSDIAQRGIGICSRLPVTAKAECNQNHYSATPVQMRFYANAITEPDQLRQRVAFALSQIVVTSDAEVHNTSGLAAYNQILLENTFGNYRNILHKITLNGYMGDYLNMADSSKAHPNENYARELLQLFSIGTVLLNLDGTPKISKAGATVAAYSNSDVKEMARALTGWTYARANGAALTDYTNRDLSQPMVKFILRFDNGAKTFLGNTVPPQAPPEANIEAVVDAVFNHPNTAPYISKRLIQQLTVAEPTPGYVKRVAAIFEDNGAGIRGDMKAVIRAIYLDKEARTAPLQLGKVKEPVLLATSLARAIGFKTDGYAFTTRDSGMGQPLFRAPSVFNYYPFDYPLPLGGGLVSPASKLMNTSTAIARHNLVYDWTVGGSDFRREFQPVSGIQNATGTQPDWSSWEANGIDDYKTIDRINLVMLNGTLTPTQRRALSNAMAAIKDPNVATQARKRAQTALYIVATSPLFQVDR